MYREYLQAMLHKLSVFLSASTKEIVGGGSCMNILIKYFLYFHYLLKCSIMVPHVLPDYVFQEDLFQESCIDH